MFIYWGPILATTLGYNSLAELKITFEISDKVFYLRIIYLENIGNCVLVGAILRN